MLNGSILFRIFRQLNIEEIYGIIKLPDKGNKRVRSAIKMKKALSLIIGTVYSLTYFVLYNIVNYIHREDIFHPFHLIITLVSLLTVLIFVYTGLWEKHFFYSAAVTSITAFVIVSIINVVNICVMEELLVVAFALQQIVTFILFYLILYVAYSVKRHRQSSIVSLIFAIVFCITLIVSLILIAKFTTTEIANTLMSYISIVLPIIMYTVLVILVKNKFVFRSAVLLLWLMCSLSLISIPDSQFQLMMLGNFVSIRVCASFANIIIWMVSLVDHVIALIISEHKKAAIKE